MVQPELIGGRYRVRSPVGHGGMGTVWLCRDDVLRRDVAVKEVGLLPGESATDSARALREARNSAALSHRNVVTVFDVVEQSGTIYLVMEYVPSRSLAEIIDQEGPLQPGPVARIGAQVADGLAAAHAADITHRDVKPSNVLVTEDGTAKISDFGIARVATEPALTQSGFVTGTPSYFSPELARGAHPDPQADVWALGAALYAAVEGRPLYAKRVNPVAVLHDIATTLPARPARAGRLEQPLMRMLDRDPASRWSMAAAAQGLRTVAEDLVDDGTRGYTRERVPVESLAPPGPDGASPGRDTSPPRRRRGRFLLLAAAGVIVLVGGLAYAAGIGGGAGHAPAAATDPPRRHTSGGPATGPTGRPAGSRPSNEASSEPSSRPSSRPSPRSGRATHQAGDRHTHRPHQASAASSAGKARVLRTYYATVPDNLDAGWSMLGPRERSVGRSSYDQFWGSMTAVDVSHITTSSGSHTVDLSLTYHYKDGRVVDERQRLTLIRASDGRWLIDHDQVLSSRTR